LSAEPLEEKVRELIHRSFNPLRISPLAALAVIVAWVSSTKVSADTGADPQTSGGIFGAQTDVTLGLAAGVDQRYMGSNEFRPITLPLAAIHRGMFFVDATRGVGAEFLAASGFYVGQAFNYDFGRGIESSALRPGSGNLRGMGDVAGTVTSTLTVAQQIVRWLSINAQAEFAVGDHRGNQYQFGLESTVLQTTKDSLVLDLDAKLGDSQYNLTYFGVTQAQSTTSGFSRFQPGSGIYAYSLAATWNHTLDKHWSTQLVVAGTRYTDVVEGSPIVESKLGTTVLMSVNYAF
jgi:MipA family protein